MDAISEETKQLLAEYADRIDFQKEYREILLDSATVLLTSATESNRSYQQSSEPRFLAYAIKQHRELLEVQRSLQELEVDLARDQQRLHELRTGRPRSPVVYDSAQDSNGEDEGWEDLDIFPGGEKEEGKEEVVVKVQPAEKVRGWGCRGFGRAHVISWGVCCGLTKKAAFVQVMEPCACVSNSQKQPVWLVIDYQTTPPLLSAPVEQVASADTQAKAFSTPGHPGSTRPNRHTLMCHCSPAHHLPPKPITSLKNTQPAIPPLHPLTGRSAPARACPPGPP